MNNKASLTEIIIDVTEEEYQAHLAKGLQEDEMLKPGRHTFRRGNFLARHGLNSENIQTFVVYLSHRGATVIVKDKP
jgi:hypothetical protein